MPHIFSCRLQHRKVRDGVLTLSYTFIQILPCTSNCLMYLKLEVNTKRSSQCHKKNCSSIESVGEVSPLEDGRRRWPIPLLISTQQ